MVHVCKIDYAPPVIDLAKADFPLLAGRVECINGRAVAALTYGRRKHRISLFVLPRKSGATDVLPNAASTASSRGFNMTAWQNKAFSFSAVSDVNANDLSTFADLIRVALDRG